MQANPLVSVLMTAYNREKYIAEAIESVLASTYNNFELIIVDDCSNDSTVVIAKSYEVKDKRVKVFLNGKNLGDYSNRNRAAGYATGEFILYTDSDDMLLKESIEKCVRLMISYPQVNFGIYYPEEGIDIAYCIPSKSAIRKQYFQSPFLQVGPGGIFTRRSFFELIGKFPEKYGPANDMYFNVKAASQSDVLVLPFPLIFYRRHDEQELHNHYSYIFNNYRYSKDLIDELELPLTVDEKKLILNKNRRRFAMNAFKYLIRTGNVNKTMNLFKEAGYSKMDLLKGLIH